jgi:hypothetical protein
MCAAGFKPPGWLSEPLCKPLYLLNGQSVRFALGSTPDPFALVKFVGDL